MTVRQYRLPHGRELRLARGHQRLFIAVHDSDGTCMSGPLAVEEAALDTLRSALCDAAGETGTVEATETTP